MVILFANLSPKSYTPKKYYLKSLILSMDFSGDVFFKGTQRNLLIIETSVIKLKK